MRSVVLLCLCSCGRLGFDPADCPPSYVSAGTSCYRVQLDTNELAWIDAERACESASAHLAVIDDDEEQAVVDQLVPPYIMDAWIGGSDRVTSGVWLTVTGEPAFLEWDDGQPENNTEHCLKLYDTGLLHDGHCGHTNDYVCEYDGLTADQTAF